MAITDDTEKRFEADIETYLLSSEGGYTRNKTAYDAELGLYPETLVAFVKATQPKEWKRFELQNGTDPERRFCVAFHNATERDGVLSVLRNGFKHKGITFRVCYFQPRSKLNQTALELYRKNVVTCKPPVVLLKCQPEQCGYGPCHQRDPGLCPGTEEPV